MTAATLGANSGECPLWVISRHQRDSRRGPLYALKADMFRHRHQCPISAKKRTLTCSASASMSAKCHKRTLRRDVAYYGEVSDRPSQCPVLSETGVRYSREGL